MNEPADVLDLARELARAYLDGLGDRQIAGAVDRDEMVRVLGGPLPEGPTPATDVIERLASGVDRGLVATNAGRFFGFVEGGVLPAALAADWLASTWDQNPAFFTLSPAAAIVEEIAAGWLLDVLGLPANASVGFTTGAQMASVAALAAARHHVMADAGWDVEADGLIGAPAVNVIVGEERHATIGRALRFLGFGERTATIVPADDQGRMDAAGLARTLDGLSGPIIVCAQAGNVNTGAFDPMKPIAEACRSHGAWMHVDGAFGLWAAAAPSLRHLVEGVELADSWATDGHKWLNTPYDSGIVACAHPDSHRTALALRAPYLVRAADGARDGSDWTPESSRRARGFAVWAALRSLGRDGVAELVDTCCAHARMFAERLAKHPDIRVLNDVVLNQVLIRVGDDDERTRSVARRLQSDGRVWMGDTVWQDTVALRISVSDHSTASEDVELAVESVLEAVDSSA